MNSTTKECSQIARHIGGVQLDLDQRQEIDGRLTAACVTTMPLTCSEDVYPKDRQ
jgi:hypothetical protein